MQLEEILSELEYNTKKFPREALEGAIAEREAITPILISTLDTFSNNLEELLEKEDYIFHIYALYLIAQFREVSAYPVIIKFFSVPGEIALNVTGDVVTEDLGRILASVCGGNIEPIKQLIENPEVNEYVRVAGLESLLVLLAQGIISREQVVQYYAKLFSDFRSREESDYIWTELVITSGEICAIELKEEIDRVFAEDLVDLFFVSQENINDDLEVGIEAALAKLRENPRHSFIDNTILEMENWSCFQPESYFQSDNSFVPEGFRLTTSKKSQDKAKKKKKMQEQSRKKNRSKKKRGR